MAAGGGAEADSDATASGGGVASGLDSLSRCIDAGNPAGGKDDTGGTRAGMSRLAGARDRGESKWASEV